MAIIRDVIYLQTHVNISFFKLVILDFIVTKRLANHVEKMTTKISTITIRVLVKTAPVRHVSSI